MRERRSDETSDPCGCRRTASHGVIYKCDEHGPWWYVDEVHDLGHILRCRIGSQNDAYAEVEAYEAYEVGPDQRRFFLDGLHEGQYVFIGRSATAGIVDTTDIDETDVAVEMSVKFDGCANYTLFEGPHVCSREELARFGELLLRCYDLDVLTLDYCGDEE